MISKAIKRWLHKMFAWWPWRQSPAKEYAHAVHPLQAGTTIQEAASWPTGEGIVPQADPPTPPRRSSFEQWPESPPQSPFPPPLTPTPTNISGQADKPPLFLPAPQAGLSTRTKDDEDTAPASPNPQRQLEFLQYLVQRGLVNEGFSEEQIPDQYKRL